MIKNNTIICLYYINDIGTLIYVYTPHYMKKTFLILFHLNIKHKNIKIYKCLNLAL
jgi:hypothetical protein